MGKTLKLCEGAITSTEALAQELKNYVKEVFVNHNVASEEMFELSQNALNIKSEIKKQDEIVIGYFSGSISHISDLEIVIPAFIKIFNEFKNVKLLLLGHINIPNSLKLFSSKILKKKYVDWKKLPELIASVDINISPIQENIFNSAKSENKWVEAALVKVPTIASDFGIFKKVIQHNVTGLLCKNQEEWYKELKALILDENLRKKIGSKAFEVCKNEYNSLKTAYKITNYVNSVTRKHIGFFLPSLQISGGIKVVLVHSAFLQEKGYDVDLIIPDSNEIIFEFQGHKFNVIILNKAYILSHYDIIVATLYSTFFTVLNYSKARRKLYLVQRYETDFYNYGSFLKTEAEKTYNFHYGIEYITISKWCKKWLKEKYGHDPKFAHNGIFFNSFTHHKRNLNKEKIRILIEGDSSSDLKNVDESFKIVDKLGKEKYEIWYMSNNGSPKNWYKVDRFLHKISYEKVNEVYKECDILLKSSWLESFSFPPLEMMATGGYSIVVPNGGNEEYLKNGENCLFYKLGDIVSAVKCIENLISNENLQQHLYENGLATAKQRDWANFRDEILSLYDN
jgi:glycosyltransferase involved in cell wall biosynthesis